MISMERMNEIKPNLSFVTKCVDVIFYVYVGIPSRYSYTSLKKIYKLFKEYVMGYSNLENQHAKVNIDNFNMGGLTSSNIQFSEYVKDYVEFN